MIYIILGGESMDLEEDLREIKYEFERYRNSMELVIEDLKLEISELKKEVSTLEYKTRQFGII
jgi:hypothetical protein